MPHRTQTNRSVKNNFYRKKQIGGATQRREVEAVLKRGTKQSVLHCTHKKNFAVLFTFLWLPWRFQEKCERKQQSSIQRSRGGERKGSQ